MRTRLLALMLTAGCGAAEEPPVTGEPPALDERALREHVQPELERLCAQTACHGTHERRFAIFGRHALRATEDAWREPRLSDEEYRANLEAARAFLVGRTDPTDSELLSKPLRVEAGGVGHAGGDQFYDRGDPTYVLLACWLGGQTGCRP